MKAIVNSGIRGGKKISSPMCAVAGKSFTQGRAFNLGCPILARARDCCTAQWGGCWRAVPKAMRKRISQVLEELEADHGMVAQLP